MGKEAKKKMVFYCWPNMALTNPWIRPNIWSHFEREKRRERGEEQKERRRGRGREEEEEKKRSHDQKGMELHGILKFCMNFHALMVISLFPKPRVLLGFLPNPRILKSNLGKTLNRTRST